MGCVAPLDGKRRYVYEKVFEDHKADALVPHARPPLPAGSKRAPFYACIYAAIRTHHRQAAHVWWCMKCVVMFSGDFVVALLSVLLAAGIVWFVLNTILGAWRRHSGHIVERGSSLVIYCARADF